MSYDAFSVPDLLLTSALFGLCIAQGGCCCASSRLLSLPCKLYDVAVCRAASDVCASVI
jgi:hypothetical protein